MVEKNEIMLITDKFNLEPEQKKPLLDSFGEYFVQAHKLVTQAKAIKVTNSEQTKEMEKARELRLSLVKLRVEANKTRITLKEGYLRGGNAVQAIYNDIIRITEPEETRLKEQEQFAILQQQAILEKRYSDRVEKIANYVDDLSLYNIKEIDDESFKKLLKEVTEKFYLKQAEREREEKELKKQQEKERKEQEKIRLHNEKLIKERKEQQKKLEIAEKARKEAEEKLAKEEEEKQRIEDEKEAKRKEELRAPDKIKYKTYINNLLNVPVPDIKDEDMNSMITKIRQALQKQIDLS